MSISRKESDYTPRKGRKKSLPLAYIFVGCVAIAAVIAVLCLKPLSSKDNGGATTLDDQSESAAAAERVRMIVGQQKGNFRRGNLSKYKQTAVDLFSDFTGEDRKIVERVQLALDDGDMKALLDAVPASMKSSNPELRERLVEALGWFGAEALPELTGMLDDASPDVAEAAFDQWTTALSEVEDARSRMKIGMSVFNIMGNSGQLDLVVGEVSCAALEYIDGEDDDEKKLERRVEVVDGLYKIIEKSRGGGLKAAMDAYEDITGFEWQGAEEAELYLQDPDNYEPPEDRKNAEEVLDHEDALDLPDSPDTQDLPNKSDSSDFGDLTVSADDSDQEDTPSPDGGTAVENDGQ